MEDKLTSEQVTTLREHQDRLIKVLSALNDLERNEQWLILKDIVFTPLIDNIKLRLLQEAVKPKIEVEKIYHLQGELIWARRYSDITVFAEDVKREIEGIKIKLKN